MSISPGRYVEVSANGTPTDPQAATDLAAATAAGALAGDIAGRAAGAEAGAQAGTEVAASAGAAAGATAGEIAGAAAGTAAGATAGTVAGTTAGAAAGSAAAVALLQSRSITGGGLATGGGTLAADRVITVTEASQAEAEAGTSDTVAITPRRWLDAFNIHVTLFMRSMLLAVDAAAARALLSVLSAADLAASSGSGLIGFVHSLMGAVARAVQSRLRDTVHVTDFGDVSGNASPAFQAAVNALRGKGGRLYVPRGRYTFGSQVVIDRAFAVDPDGGFIGERSLEIVGYGAEIVSTGAFAPFKFVGGWAPNVQCITRGLTIDHGSATDPVGAFLISGAPYVRFSECVVRVNGGLPSGYYGWRFEQSDPADPDTGSFWGEVDLCIMRGWSGADGNADTAVQIVGTSNAVSVTRCSFGSAETHIQIKPHVGYDTAANAVVLWRNAHESPATATGIEVDGGDGLYHATGLRITHNRFETIDTAVRFIGSAALVQIPAVFAQNYADGSLTTYFDNVSGVAFENYDAAHVGAPGVPPITLNNENGTEIRNQDGSKDALSVFGAAAGRGLALKNFGGTRLGRWAPGTVAGGNGSVFGGTYTSGYNPLALTGVNSITTRDVAGNNLAGAVALSAETTKAVSFPGGAEPDTGYHVWLTGETNATLWVSGKTTGGFQINASTAVSGVVGWFLIRTT